MDEISLIVDLHLNQERQGPGSSTDTLMAMGLAGLAGQEGLQIADIGCGTGAQTITLAKALDAEIMAVDLFPAFLEKLDLEARRLGLANQIKTLKASMDDLPFAHSSLDVIWSEGAIYNMGFEAGISQWRSYLKPGGMICVSEITWITNQRPDALTHYWATEYPEIDTAATKMALLEKHGYTPMGYFVLPEDSWISTYYEPLEAGIPAFLAKHQAIPLAQKVADDYQKEFLLYKKYKSYFSYGFYIARKI